MHQFRSTCSVPLEISTLNVATLNSYTNRTTTLKGLLARIPATNCNNFSSLCIDKKYKGIPMKRVFVSVFGLMFEKSLVLSVPM